MDDPSVTGCESDLSPSAEVTDEVTGEVTDDTPATVTDDTPATLCKSIHEIRLIFKFI